MGTLRESVRKIAFEGGLYDQVCLTSVASTGSCGEAASGFTVLFLRFRVNVERRSSLTLRDPIPGKASYSQTSCRVLRCELYSSRFGRRNDHTLIYNGPPACGYLGRGGLSADLPRPRKAWVLVRPGKRWKERSRNLTDLLLPPAPRRLAICCSHWPEPGRVLFLLCEGRLTCWLMKRTRYSCRSLEHPSRLSAI